MQVSVNGSAMEVEAGTSLTDLLEHMGLGARWVVAERNGQPVPRGEMAATALAEGDRIELVRAVAGG
ncbi:MAG TPA: sulfur carrier protein ThiS [Acidimicrobiales bacterium]|jgi:sulfur carrier protein|nr:sulfur carrier protein ThiS [Acidimicrobiales bacterium]